MVDKADLRRYCDCLTEVRNRIDVATRIIDGALINVDDDIIAELLCVQLRKSLELVALAALSANRAYYEKAYIGIANVWNAKDILKEIGALHPHFYPTPIKFGGLDPEGRKRFDPLTSGFMTKEQFVSIYDKLGGALHAWNPHRREPRRVGAGLNFRKWFEHLETLLALHYFHLPDDDSIYVCELRGQGGKVHVHTGSPVQAN